MTAQPALATPRVSPEEYLRLEREAEEKSEYFDGTIKAMAGASPSHIRITNAISGLLFTQLRGRPCEAMTAEQRVRTPNNRSYTYPDVLVACKPEYANDGFSNLTNPVVIFEVLSPSTEQLDRTKKFARYRTIPTLRDYILVSQNSMLVEHYSKATQLDREHWWVRFLENPEDELVLDSVGCRLKLADIYERVEFPVHDEYPV